MKVFISWSGSLSRRVAELLREWLPNVLQAVDPWMSAEDIEKGARWNSDIANELEKTKAGILCLTPDNIEAPWLIFEAGALSKTLEKTFVSPYLLGLRPSDLKGPLVQFQAAEANKHDTRRLLETLNRALGETALSEKQLDKTFEIWWPELETSFQKIRSAKTPQLPQRSEREILEEILALVRDQAKRPDLKSVLLLTGGRQEEPLCFVGAEDASKIQWRHLLWNCQNQNTKIDPASLRLVELDQSETEKPKVSEIASIKTKPKQ
jgi:hypothetical protein